MATVQYILANKGFHVHTISASATVLEATRLMNSHKIGALVVREADHIVGIFTERDVLRQIVAEERSPSNTRVSEVMTRNVICCQLDTGLDEASLIMRDRRIRHLPVCDEAGRPVGLVSIGDLNAYHASIQEAMLNQLNDYVYGRS